LCKVLGLKFLKYKKIILIFYFFGLGSELKTNQAFQPLAPPCSLNMVRKDIMDEGWVEMEV
jgi:hypothetical protein